MQLIRTMAACVVLVLAPAGAAQAQICTLALGTGGTLGLSADGTVLGSQAGLGLPGTLTIVSVGSNAISVSAPSRVSAAPPGYNTSGEEVQVAYSGASGLAGISQGYTSNASGFSVGTIALSILTLHNRIINPNGFAAGSYTTRTVVTCN